MARLPNGTRSFDGIAAGALQQRIEGAAEIGAEHHHHRRMGVDHAGRRQGHDEQHRGDARMGKPRKGRRQKNENQRIRSDHREKVLENLRRFDRTNRLAEEMQREQHQAQADGHAPEVLDSACLASAVGDETAEDQGRKDEGDVEGQDLHDQRRAHIRAEHDGQGRYHVDSTACGE